MDHRKDIRSSPRKSKKSNRSPGHDRSRRRLSSNSNFKSKREHRVNRVRRSSPKGCCQNAERCKGIGAVLITLAIPASIAGVILTVVAATDDDDDKDGKYPDSFLAVGPLLLVFAVIFLITGLCLYSPYISGCVHRRFSLDEPNSFCRLHCKTLSQCLKPDDTIERNQAALKALQTEPGKPALKRNKLASDTSETMNGIAEDATIASETLDEKRGHAHPASRGVRFSDSDIADVEDSRDHHSNLSDSGSALSLRHCKIFPKSGPYNIWWTDEVTVKENSHELQKYQTTEL